LRFIKFVNADNFTVEHCILTVQRGGDVFREIRERSEWIAARDQLGSTPVGANF
jgi:hypothetical protein